MIRSSEILREARDAVIAHRFAGSALQCPYRKGTKRAWWWGIGVERASRAADKLMEIGA